MNQAETQLLKDHGYRWQLVSSAGEVLTVPEALRRVREQIDEEEYDAEDNYSDPKWWEARGQGTLRWVYIGDGMYYVCYWNAEQEAWLTHDGLNLVSGSPDDYDAIWRPEHKGTTWDRSYGSPPWSRDDVNSTSPTMQLMDLFLRQLDD